MLLKKRTVGFVAKLIAPQLPGPILGTGSGYPSFRTAGMLMPEAAVHQYYFPARREDNVRVSWQVATMQPETVSEAVNEAAQNNLRARVLAANAPHVRAAPFRADLIHRRTRKTSHRSPGALSRPLPVRARRDNPRFQRQPHARPAAEMRCLPDGTLAFAVPKIASRPENPGAAQPS